MEKRKLIYYITSTGNKVLVEQYCQERGLKSKQAYSLKDFFEKLKDRDFSEIIVDYFFVNEICQKEVAEKFIELIQKEVLSGVKLKLIGPCVPLETKEIKPEYSRWVKRNFPKETIYKLFDKKETPV